MTDKALRAALLKTARQLNGSGLNQGTAGNLAARSGEGFLVTPSGRDYDTMTAGDLVAMTFDGKWTARRGLKPSSEWRIHRDILAARQEVGAVVHCHAPFATALACDHMAIPAFHYMVAVAGGDSIRCAGYATFGTAALSQKVLVALKGRKAALMANHGLIACGGDPADALRIAIEVEALAAQYWRALQVGKPKLLSKIEMAKVIKKFSAGYGYGSGPAES